MNLIDWILNLAGLFLWIDWRSGTLAKRPKSVLSLASTARPAGRRIATGLGSLGALLFILLVRPCFYYTVGSKLGWTPSLDLFTFSIPWRSDLLDRMYIYSTLGFLLVLGFFWCAMLLLSAVNRKLPDSDVMQQFVRLQLGIAEHLPWWIKLLLPGLAAGAAWFCAVPLLAWLEIIPSVPPQEAVRGEALAFALAAYLAWKWFLIILFLLHLLNAHVYLGTHPVWPYISLTARKLLKPVSFLTLSRFDLAPIAGMVLTYCAADFLLRPLVIHFLLKFPP